MDSLNTAEGKFMILYIICINKLSIYVVKESMNNDLNIHLKNLEKN